MYRLATILAGPGAFRLFLAALVVVQHLSRARIGLTAVMVFFILSGFWVSRICQEKFLVCDRPVWQFYLSRFMRLWPAYVAAVLLAVLLARLAGAPFDPRDLNGLALFGTATLQRDPLGVSWSLDIEAQFYLMLPLLMLVGARFGLAGLIVATGLGLSLGWWLFAGFRIWTALQYLPLFLAGLLIWRQDWRPKGGPALLSVALFLAAGAAFYQIDAARGLVVVAPMPRPWQLMGAMVWALLLIPFVAWNVRQRGGGHDRILGDLSYSLYLTHYPIISALKLYAPEDFGPDMKLIAVVLAAIVGLAFWYAIDRPIEEWRARLFRG